MQCLIIIGSNIERQNIIDQYIQKLLIKPYNFYNIENVKIADVRTLQRTISQRLSRGEKRLVIIQGTITTESQNALLKTIEEIRESTYIIFSYETQYSLLPTIISRCKLIRLNSKIFDDASISDNFTILEDTLNKATIDKGSLFKIYEEVAGSKDPKEVAKNIIRNAREILLKSAIGDHDKIALFNSYCLLENFLRDYQLIINNNINTRLALETSLLNI